MDFHLTISCNSDSLCIRHGVWTFQFLDSPNEISMEMKFSGGPLGTGVGYLHL